MDPSKWLLLLGTALVGLVVLTVWLVGGGAGTSDELPGGVASGDIAATSTSEVPTGGAAGSAADAGSSTGEGQAKPAGTTEEGSAASAEATDELSSEACAQFEAGHTVADFAEWFEEQFQGDEAEVADVFRAVLTQALTEECPEVVPDN